MIQNFFILFIEVVYIFFGKFFSHTVNLLTSVPFKCYSEMTTPATSDLPKELEFEGRNMEAIEVLLEFLDQRLTPAAEVSRKKKANGNGMFLFVHL